MITRKIGDGQKASEERSKVIENIYTGLSHTERDKFEDALFDYKARTIHAYSEDLGVDLTTAYAFHDKMCAEYPQPKPSNE